MVILQILVSDAGNPIEIRVIQEARAGLTQAAIHAVRQWLFEPAFQGGRPVTTWTTVRVPFEAIPFGPETRFGEETGASQTREPVTAVRTPTRSLPVPRAPPTLAPVPTRAVGIRLPVEPEAVYRTRSAVLFAVSPEQARVFVDDRYIGVADDWDESGGGLAFRFARRGGHQVRFELPGYRDLVLEVVVTSAAEEDAIEIDEELERVSREPYPRLPSVAAQTSEGVEFAVEPPNATVSENGRILGLANSFTRSRPLRLSGPEVHDLILSAPGRRPKRVRVMVALWADAETARIEATLAPDRPQR